MTEAKPTSEQPIGCQPWGFWATSGLGLIIVIVYFTFTLLFASIAILPSVDTGLDQGLDTADTNVNIVITATLVSAVIGTLLILLITRRRRGASWTTYLAVNLPTAKELLIWMGVTAVMLILLGMIGSLLDRPAVPEYWVELYSASSILPLFLLAVVAAPIFEESHFRGFLFKGWSNSKLGVIGTIFLTAALFTTLHAGYDAFDLGQVLVLGIVLGVARYQSGSLVVPVAMHALTNALALLQMTYILGN